MIKDIFQYDNVHNRIELNTPEILLVQEFAELMKNERNICKEDPTGELKLRAFREFQYIWLAIDWKSIFSDYSEQERHQEALRDAQLTEEEFNNPEFRAACRKYKQIQESNKSVQLLNAAKEMVDKFIDYFKLTDPLERDEQTGKPFYKVKDIQAEMKNLIDVHETMVSLENQVKKQIESQSQLRGGYTDGYVPKFLRNNG